MTVIACGPRKLPPGRSDQSIHDAMVLVCDAPNRAEGDSGRRADAIAGHLSDGVGNPKVLATVEGWKTDGISRRELDRLLRRAGINECALRAEAQ